MILVNCNSEEYLNEIGYIAPSDILDIVPVKYKTEIIYTNNTNKTNLSTTLKNKLSEYSNNSIHSYKELGDLDKLIIFYVSGAEFLLSDPSDPEHIKDVVVFCIVCDLQYSKERLLKLMKRYSKLRAFV
jgi:hypothetical protein